jgi:RNA polymerase sigma-54 factor
MALRTSQSVENKNKLSSTLRNWLPILHSSLGDLEEAMAPFVQGNPLIEVKSGYEENFEKKTPQKDTVRSRGKELSNRTDRSTDDSPPLFVRSTG